MKKFKVAVDVDRVGINKGRWLFGALGTFWHTDDILRERCICNNNLIRYSEMNDYIY